MIEADSTMRYLFIGNQIMFARELGIYILIPGYFYEGRNKIDRIPQILNLQSSIFISGFARLGFT